MELATDHGVNLGDELTRLQECINSCNDLENVLFHDIFSVEEKLSILQVLAEKLSMSKWTHHFVQYLILEKRMNIFPLIYKEFIVLEDHQKGFLRGTITGADEEVSPETIDLIKKFLEKKLQSEIELKYESSENVTAGFRVTVEDLQLDATVDNQLEQLKNSIIGDRV